MKFGKHIGRETGVASWYVEFGDRVRIGVSERLTAPWDRRAKGHPLWQQAVHLLTRFVYYHSYRKVYHYGPGNWDFRLLFFGVARRKHNVDEGMQRHLEWLRERNWYESDEGPVGPDPCG